MNHENEELQELLGDLQIRDIDMPNDICHFAWRDATTGISPLLLSIQCGNIRATELLLSYKYTTLSTLIENEKYHVDRDKVEESVCCGTLIHVLIAKNKQRLIMQILSKCLSDKSMISGLINYINLPMKCKIKSVNSRKSFVEYVTCLEYALLMDRKDIAKDLLNFTKQALGETSVKAIGIEKLVRIAVISDMNHKMTLTIITTFKDHDFFTSWQNIRNLLKVALDSGNLYLVRHIFDKFKDCVFFCDPTVLVEFIEPIFSSKDEDFALDFIDAYVSKYLLSELPNLLLTFNAKQNVLVSAVANGLCRASETFLNAACQISNVSYLRLETVFNSLLECAAEKRHSNIIKILFEKMVGLNIKLNDQPNARNVKISHQFWHNVISNSFINDDKLRAFNEYVFKEYHRIKQKVTNEMHTLSIFRLAVDNDNVVAIKFILEERNLVTVQNAENLALITNFFRLACKTGKTGAIKLLLNYVVIEENILSLHHCIRFFSRIEKLEQNEFDLLQDICTLLQNHKLADGDNCLTLLDVVDSSGRRAIDSVVDAINPNEIINVFQKPSMPIRRSLTRILLHLINNKPEAYETLFQRFGDDKLKHLNDVIVARKVMMTDGTFTYDMTTPLHIFSEMQDINMLKKMVHNNADLLAMDSNGDTVLHLLVKLSALRKDKEMEYLKLTNTILNVYLNNIVSSSITDKRERCHIAFIILTRLFVNRQSMSVVSYAMYHKATAMLEFLLTATAESITKYNGDTDNPVIESLREGNLSTKLSDVTGLCTETVPGNLSNKQLYEELSSVVKSSHDDPSFLQKRENILVSDPPVKTLQKMRLAKNGSFLDILADISFNKSEFADVLKIPVVRQLVSKYNRQYRLAMMFVLVLHIFFMLLATSIAVTQSLPNNLSLTSGNVSQPFVDRCKQTSMSSDDDVTRLIILVTYNIIALIVHFYFVLSTLYRHKKMKTILRNDSLSISTVKYVTFLYCMFFFQAAPAIAWLFLRLLCHAAQPYVISLYLGFGWVFTIFHMKSFKNLHIFTSALISVMKKACLFFVSIVIFLPIGLGCALYVLLAFPPAIYGSSSNIGEQIWYMATKLSFNLGGTFDADNTVENNDIVRIAFIQIIYLICVVLMTLLVLNLVIAMMNDRYQTVKENQLFNWHVRSLRRAQHLRHAFPILVKMLLFLQLQADCFLRNKKRNFRERRYAQSSLLFFEYTLKVDTKKKKLAVTSASKETSFEAAMIERMESIEKKLTRILENKIDMAAQAEVYPEK